jgi:hypothetical protein
LRSIVRASARRVFQSKRPCTVVDSMMLRMPRIRS